MNSWTTLVSPEALAEALGDDRLVVLDARFSLAAPEAGEAAYRRSHIPGARYAHLDRDLSGPRAAAGAGRHPWPDEADFIARLDAWGVTPAHQVVAYDDGDGAHAARLWFLLQALGHARAAVLDGGWARWSALGLPVQHDVPAPAPSAYGAAGFDRQRLLAADQVQAHLADGGLLIDARAAERFRGEVEPIDRKAGHVPGAVNRPYARNLAEGGAGAFKPASQLAEEFARLLDGRAPREVAVMCGSGVTACHHLLAMAHAGLQGAKLYTGSWSGWIEDPARAIAVGER
ncbi:sulfurtransferase [Luteimonas aquatica]|uniref:sulfurtransferase n=1 Tax=Luteimonas aquatica TaxID=450364 RepID=UPI001F5A6633|nr:sulfurtransferase [Luteimonas aquatica]